MVGPGARNLITDVAGLRVGHAEDHIVMTGVTVVLADEPFVTVCDAGLMLPFALALVETVKMGMAGVTLLEAVESGLVPMLLVAVTIKL